MNKPNSRAEKANREVARFVFMTTEGKAVIRNRSGGLASRATCKPVVQSNQKIVPILEGHRKAKFACSPCAELGRSKKGKAYTMPGIEPD